MLDGISARLHMPTGFGFRGGLPARNVSTDSLTAGTGATAVSAQSHLATELTVVTREGDTVTLDWSRDASVTYSRSTAAVDRDGDGTPDTTSEITSLERSVKTAFSLNVQGDLNEQELADIRRIVHAVKHALRDFAHGDAAGAAEDIARARTSGSLASVQAEFEATSSVTVAQTQARTSTLPPKPAVEPVPVTPAPITEVTTAPTPTPAPAVDADGDHDSDAGRETVERLRQANEHMRAWLHSGESRDRFHTHRAPQPEEPVAVGR